MAPLFTCLHKSCVDDKAVVHRNDLCGNALAAVMPGCACLLKAGGNQQQPEDQKPTQDNR